MLKPEHYPLLIAAASVVIVPLILWVVRQLWSLWEENRQRRLDSAIDTKLKLYVTTEVLEMKLDTLTAHTDELHAQNRLFLEAIRSEGQKREGMILGALEATSAERRNDMEVIRQSIGVVHARVDRVLELSIRSNDQRSTSREEKS